MNELLTIITSNEGKFKEYEKKLNKFTEVKMLDIGYPEIQADSLEEVVSFCIEELSEYSPLIIDDSGLFVDKLDGFPGVYSSYVMKTIGNEGILSLLRDVEHRDARFECVIGLLDGEKRLFKGVSRGEITKEKVGNHGFGYDPIFRPEGRSKTFAEMETEEKNEISHRGRAMEKLISYMEKKY